ncbi:MAG: hypothetical protein AAGF87_03745 [Bacteroidota bacterium]
MKYHNLYWFIAILFIASACQEDDGLTREEPSHRVVFTSEMDYNNEIEVDNRLSFGDISTGIESRTWTFPEGVVDIIGSDNDVTSTEANVRAEFTEVGVYEVKLNQVFKEDAFVGNFQRGRELDTSIIITVFDSIQASVDAFYINDDGTTGAQLDLSPGASNDLPAAEFVRLVYTGTGSPKNLTWTIEGGTPSFYSGPELQLDVEFKFLGEYGFALSAGRQRPAGLDEIEFENIVNVIPSTEPVSLERITDVDGQIGVVYSRAIDPETIDPSEFTVAISNGFFQAEPTVASIALDPVSPNILILDIGGEPIYNDDAITISYSGPSLISADGVVADQFTDETLIFNKVNILANLGSVDYGFENSGVENWMDLGWGDNWALYTIDISNTVAYTGDNSLFVNMDPEGGMIIGNVDLNEEFETFPVLTDKAYELGLWVYVEDPGDPTVGFLKPDIRLYWGPDTDFNLGPNPELNPDFPIGEWVYSSAFIEFQEAGDKSLWIRGFNGINPLNYRLYIDEITLAEVELRP